MPQVAENMVYAHKKLLVARLEKLGAKILTNTRCQKITDQGVVIISDNKEKQLEADHVLIATGDQPNTALFTQLKDQVDNIYVAGDCKGVASILEAIESGYKAGQAV